jgi:hypothetical protein
MRRTHLRGHNNILKRQLIHVGAFNLSLILRQLMGAGTPREWKNRGGMLFWLIYSLLARHEGPVWVYSGRISMFRVKYSATTRNRTLRCRSQRSPIYTTGCYGVYGTRHEDYAQRHADRRTGLEGVRRTPQRHAGLLWSHGRGPGSGRQLRRKYKGRHRRRPSV